MIGVFGKSGQSVDKFGLIQSGDAAAASANLSSKGTIPLDRWIDVLPLVDLDRDVVSGKWRRDGNAIVAERNPGTRVAIPLAIAGGYDLAIDFTLRGG